MATLYMVATPLGNLGDITLRALETLRSAALIAAEDTRRTRQLLSHFDIHAKLLSCRAQNELQAANQVIATLKAGGDVAYASDAGSPAVSDPGAVLAGVVAEAGFAVIPIPGPSAFAALVSVAGGRDKCVLFEGFLSPKPGRRRARLQQLLATQNAFVLYESPFRLLKLLADLAEFDSGRYVCLGREMTKAHEEYLRGTVDTVLALLNERQEIKGECSVYVSGRTSKTSQNVLNLLTENADDSMGV
jgi:16S rRNA (cytidine1402-2'-O)-methyltransferase